MSKKRKPVKNSKPSVIDDVPESTLWLTLFILLAFLFSYLGTTYLIKTTDFEDKVVLLVEYLNK